MDEELSYDEVAALSTAEMAVKQIRDWILSGSLPAGKALPSERMLAERLKVSRTAVRAALQILTEDGLVLTSPRRIRVVSPTAPAATRSTLLSNTIAVLVLKGFSEVDRRHNRPAWAAPLYHTVMETVMQAGFSTLFFTEDQLAGEGIARLTSDPPCGFIVAHDPVGLETKDRLMKALNQGRVPVVAWGDSGEWPDCDVVVSDHESGSYELTRWLVGQGCRRLLRCRPVLAPIPNWVRQRDAGFERAVREAGLALLPPLDIPTLAESESSKPVFEQMTHLLAGYLFQPLSGAEPVDALLAISDSYVAEIASACRILNRNPARDVLIAGYDNCWQQCVETEWESQPPRVTVDKNDALMGKAVAELMLDRLAGKLPASPQHRVVPHKLVILSPSLSETAGTGSSGTITPPAG
jgi:DNA-binding LacI/PurR family transcriptional regulator